MNIKNTKDDELLEKEFTKIDKKIIEDQMIDNFKPVNLSELFAMEFPESKWVIEKLIPYQGITIISGAPASYKTWLLLRMALDIAKGESLFGQFKCEKYKILIIDEENHLRLVRDRLQLLGADSTLPIYFLSQNGFLVSDKKLVEKVLAICKQYEIDIIFIDSLVRVNDAEENDASQMSEVFRCIKYFCQQGKTVIITHHERKESASKTTGQNRLRGSSDISAAVDAHISLVRDKEDKSKILVEQVKLRADKEIETFEFAIKENEGKIEFIYLGLCQPEINKKDSAKEIALSVLEKYPDGLSINEICQKVKGVENIGDKNIRDAVKELLSKEILSEKKGEGNTKICYLPKFSKEEIIDQKALI